MNRKIKFRGKQFHDGIWVCGYLGIDQNKNHLINAFRKGFEKWWEFVIPETVGQYTGMKDANGVEIYEGDQLGHPNNVVEFSNGMFSTNGDRPVCTQLNLVVIGNIHDNNQEE